MMTKKKKKKVEGVINERSVLTILLSGIVAGMRSSRAPTIAAVMSPPVAASVVVVVAVPD